MKTKTVYYALLRYDRECRHKLQKLTAMKRFAFLFLFISLFQQVNANVYAQGININVQQESLENVLNILKRQSEYSFIWGDKQMEIAKKVTVSLKNVSLKEAMDLVMVNQPLDYTIEERRKLVIIRIKHTKNENLGETKGIGIDPIELTGRVTNEKGEPVVGATISVKNTDIITTTGIDGQFSITVIDNKAILTITSVGYEPRIIKLTGNSKIEIKMIVAPTIITEVIVKGSTGYQVIDKDHPGSFDVINNTLLNRRVSNDILSRIENLTPGISFNNPVDGILIRGRNSIYSKVSPLIVVDNFPYDGDINNINPNDVESITILKDAAAAAQWGARSGNGVIVITTKRGKSNKPTISLNTSIMFQEKPRVNNLKTISSNDYIDLEKWLFNKGYYDGDLANTYLPGPITPVVELLSKVKNGEIDQDKADQYINSYRGNDVRDDLQKYFYRNIWNQQYSFNISANTNFLNYYLSVGWDRTPSMLIGQQSNRISIRSQNIFKVSKKIQFTTGLNYVQGIQRSGGNQGLNINSGQKSLYPYADLVDGQGNALALVRDYRQSYIDTVGQGKLLDWKYRPYQEIQESENNVENVDLVLNAGIRYSILQDLNIDLSYQFENSNYSNSLLNKVGAYSTRNLINTYYQPNSNIKFPVPIGGISDVTNGLLKSHQARVQINYDKNISGNHELHAFVGWEIKNLINKSSQVRMYGYDREGSLVYPEMDFATEYPLFTDQFSTAKIPNSQSIAEQLDRFISVYANLEYGYKDRYILSASIRNDAANLFGVKTNQKGVPLWSAGINWKLSEEAFYNLKFLPVLRLRATYGVNGNFSRTTSALATASYSTNQLGLRYAILRSAPNDKLRWEQVRTLNLGIDFETKNNVVFGSVEYFTKRNKDLMAQAPIDPTMGIGPSFYGNVANIKGQGLEVNITSNNIRSNINWQTNFLFSYSMMKVSNYYYQTSQTSTYFLSAAESLAPIVGKPMFSMYSLAWAGLDPLNGDPQGYYGKGVSKDYQAMLQKTPVDSLIFHGPVQAPFFGAIRNTFTWNNISLSFNISYRLGFYFRRNSISYNELFSTWSGHSDYEKRWQNSGDESRTNVPSLVYIDYPSFPFRDQFYKNSSALVEKGDNIRLEDINISYLINKGPKAFPFKQMRIYAYLNNLNGIIWRANKLKLDPLYPNGNLGPGKSFSLGVSVDL